MHENLITGLRGAHHKMVVSKKLTREKAMAVSKMHTAINLYVLFVAGYVDRESIKFMRLCQEANCYKQRTKQIVNNLRDVAKELNANCRMMERDFLNKTIAFGLNFYRPKYEENIGSLVGLLQARCMEVNATQWQMFTATTANFINKYESYNPLRHVIAQAMVMNGLTNIALTAIKEFNSEIDTIFGPHSANRSNAYLRLFERAVAETVKFNGTHGVNDSLEEHPMFQQAAGNLEKFSTDLIDNCEQFIDSAFYDAEKMFTRWYFAMAVADLHENGQLPKEVRKEFLSLFGMSTFGNLSKEMRRFARESYEPDPMDMADVMEGAKFTEKCVAIVLENHHYSNNKQKI